MLWKIAEPMAAIGTTHFQFLRSSGHCWRSDGQAAGSTSSSAAVQRQKLSVKGGISSWMARPTTQLPAQHSMASDSRTYGDFRAVPRCRSIHQPQSGEQPPRDRAPGHGAGTLGGRRAEGRAEIGQHEESDQGPEGAGRSLARSALRA